MGLYDHFPTFEQPITPQPRREGKTALERKIRVDCRSNARRLQDFSKSSTVESTTLDPMKYCARGSQSRANGGARELLEQ